MRYYLILSKRQDNFSSAKITSGCNLEWPWIFLLQPTFQRHLHSLLLCKHYKFVLPKSGKRAKNSFFAQKLSNDSGICCCCAVCKPFANNPHIPRSIGGGEPFMKVWQFRWKLQPIQTFRLWVLGERSIWSKNIMGMGGNVSVMETFWLNRIMAVWTSQIQGVFFNSPPYLIFVTDTRTASAEKKSVMWRNFKFLYMTDEDFVWRKF